MNEDMNDKRMIVTVDGTMTPKAVGVFIETENGSYQVTLSESGNLKILKSSHSERFYVIPRNSNSIEVI